MKKLYYSLTALLFFAAGCSNNDFMDNEGIPAPVAKSQTITSINATIDNADTRSYLKDGHQVAWEENDRILVFSDEDVNFFPYSISSITSPTSATFVGEAVTGSEFYAVYPEWLNDLNFNAHTITIPWNYDIIYSQENYDKHIPMFAKGSDSKMQFKQLGGLLHFQLEGQENTRLDYVQLWGNNEENFYWSYDLNYTADDIVLAPNVAYGGNLYLGYGIQPHEDGMSQYLSETEPFDFWFSLPAGMTFENGFTLRVGVVVENQETQEETYMEVPIVSDKAFTVTRAAVRNYPAVNITQMANETYNKIYNALMDFFNAMNGANWVDNTNWGNKNVPFDQWFGLDGNDNTVYGINMWENKVSGDIPASIVDLTDLQTIVIQGRHAEHGDDITGQFPDVITLPDEFSQLTKLTWLELGQCGLTRLPDLSGMTNLQHVYLPNNYLSGSLPSVFPNLPNLTELSLQNNRFTNSIPSSYFNPAGNWTQLSLRYNYLSGTITKAQRQTQFWENLTTKEFNEQKDGGYIIFEGAVYGIESDGWYGVAVDETININLTIKHDNAQNTDVVWDIVYWNDQNGVVGHSSVDAPITLDDNGNVTGLRPGGVQIMVSDAEGNGVVCPIWVEVQ